MRLTRLIGKDFRNLQPFDLSLDAPFVVFCGANAQGKTNALEAVHMLCTLKPLRGRRSAELIRFGAEKTTVSGFIRHRESTSAFRVDLGSKGRQCRLDGKRVVNIEKYFDRIRCISFQPLDGRIVAGEPKFRRQWVDRAAFTASPSHLGIAKVYRRALEQKVSALRSGMAQRPVLEAFNDQLARAGAELTERRSQLLNELRPHIRRVHDSLVDGANEVSLTLRTDAKGNNTAERYQSLMERFNKVASDEIRRSRVLCGPHTDDVKVALDGRSARTYGSRGQVRSLVLALKLAEMVAARQRGDVPLFLIDDVSSELDRERTRRLVAQLRDLGAQVLATTTDPGHMDSLPREETLMISVDSGSLTNL